MLRISVAMCTYNGSRFLDDQLTSILRQQRLPDELVICDDHSSDDTLERLFVFKQKAPFPVVISLNPKNTGSTPSFAKAIGLCEGDIIALCDQDDLWYPWRLFETEHLFMGLPNIGIVFGNADIINDRSEITGRKLWELTRFARSERAMFESNHAFDCLLNHNVVTGATMAFMARLREHVSPIPDQWIHDHWIALVCSSLSRAAAIEKPLIAYRAHQQQQIGATPTPPIGSRLSWPRESTVAYCRQQIEAYEMLRERLERIGAYPKYVSCCADKISHLRHRASIPNTYPRKAVSILAELAKRRYHRYSNGFLTAARDFVIN